MASSVGVLVAAVLTVSWTVGCSAMLTVRGEFGDINAGGARLTGLADPIVGSDAVTRDYLEASGAASSSSRSCAGSSSFPRNA